MSGIDDLPRHAPLAAAPPAPIDRRLAMFAILSSAAGFLLMAPFAQVPLPAVPAFIPAYESALAICNLITAILMLGQFIRLRRRSLLAVAGGYLFCAVMVVAHALTFPEVFSPTGLLGATAQSAAWLYVFWHGGFPVFLLAYALIARSGRDRLEEDRNTALLAVGTFAAVLLVAVLLVVASIAWVRALPLLIFTGDYSRITEIGVSPAILLLTLAGIAALWPRRRASVLDVWLSAVLWVWLADVALTAVIGSSRFDLGWYGGRSFGLLAASVVLASLLVESNALYAKLAAALEAARAQNVELVRSRSELARVQRLEALGQLTGGIAHDFNNLLTAITGGLDMIARRPEDHARTLRLTANALSAAERGARLISQLMSFARKQNLRPEVIDLNAMLLEFASLAGRAAGEGIVMEMDLDAGVRPVVIDASEFQAAMLNLVGNARDAMPEGGRLTIESRNLDLARAEPHGGFAIPAGRYVTIAVTDTGSGMDAEVQAKVFEPFFTTKPVGAGTGLGLSQVFGFVKTAGGHVVIRSAPGAGASLRLYLPVAEETLAEETLTAGTAAAGTALRPAAAGETILVVEDDEYVAVTTAESLRDLGYQVLSASEADAALRCLAEDRRIDLLFSDLVMPGAVGGVELARAALSLRPGLRVLLTSGYAGAALQERGLPADLPFLGKPYRRDELAEKLRRVLGAD